VSNIELHIERLIVEGIPLSGGTPRLLQAAVESELTRLLGEGGLASHLAGALPRLAGPAIQLSGSNGPTELGRQIADSVYRAIGGSAAEGIV
jgi:hypothetical protein